MPSGISYSKEGGHSTDNTKRPSKVSLFQYFKITVKFLIQAAILIAAPYITAGVITLFKMS